MKAQPINAVCSPAQECSCVRCQSSCQRKPGWFAFGEIERLATFLGVGLQTLFRKYLAVDSFVDVCTVGGMVDRQKYWVIAPAVVQKKRLSNGDYSGQCVFFKEGRCSIHPVKPLECREGSCKSDGTQVRLRAAITWATEEAQQQIQRLKGRN